MSGKSRWSKLRIIQKLQAIEALRKKKPGEKSAHFDFNWKNGNRFHAYIARDFGRDPDAPYFV